MSRPARSPEHVVHRLGAYRRVLEASGRRRFRAVGEVRVGENPHRFTGGAGYFPFGSLDSVAPLVADG